MSQTATRPASEARLRAMARSLLSSAQSAATGRGEAPADVYLLVGRAVRSLSEADYLRFGVIFDELVEASQPEGEWPDDDDDDRVLESEGRGR